MAAALALYDLESLDCFLVVFCSDHRVTVALCLVVEVHGAPARDGSTGFFTYSIGSILVKNIKINVTLFGRI
jgi:hypothetical protein